MASAANTSGSQVRSICVQYPRVSGSFIGSAAGWGLRDVLACTTRAVSSVVAALRAKLAVASGIRSLVSVRPSVYAWSVRLDEKARENLEAADRLLSTEGSADLPLHNATASRAYYAAYQAVADRAQQVGIQFDGAQADYYRHDRLPSRARDSRILDDDQRDDLERLHALRVKADYWEDQVDYEEAAAATESARGIVDAILGSAS